MDKNVPSETKFFELMKLVRPFLEDTPEVLNVVERKYMGCSDAFRTSDDCLHILTTTISKVNSDSKNVCVHLRSLVQTLKNNKDRTRKRKHDGSDSRSESPVSLISSENEDLGEKRERKKQKYDETQTEKICNSTATQGNGCESNDTGTLTQLSHETWGQDLNPCDVDVPKDPNQNDVSVLHDPNPNDVSVLRDPYPNDVSVLRDPDPNDVSVLQDPNPSDVSVLREPNPNNVMEIGMNTTLGDQYASIYSNDVADEHLLGALKNERQDENISDQFYGELRKLGLVAQNVKQEREPYYCDNCKRSEKKNTSGFCVVCSCKEMGLLSTSSMGEQNTASCSVTEEGCQDALEPFLEASDPTSEDNQEEDYLAGQEWIGVTDGQIDGKHASSHLEDPEADVRTSATNDFEDRPVHTNTCTTDKDVSVCASIENAEELRDAKFASPLPCNIVVDGDVYRVEVSREFASEGGKLKASYELDLDPSACARDADSDLFENESLLKEACLNQQCTESESIHLCDVEGKTNHPNETQVTGSFSSMSDLGDTEVTATIMLSNTIDDDLANGDNFLCKDEEVDEDKILASTCNELKMEGLVTVDPSLNCNYACEGFYETDRGWQNSTLEHADRNMENYANDFSNHGTVLETDKEREKSTEMHLDNKEEGTCVEKRSSQAERQNENSSRSLTSGGFCQTTPKKYITVELVRLAFEQINAEDHFDEKNTDIPCKDYSSLVKKARQKSCQVVLKKLDSLFQDSSQFVEDGEVAGPSGLTHKRQPSVFAKPNCFVRLDPLSSADIKKYQGKLSSGSRSPLRNKTARTKPGPKSSKLKKISSRSAKVHTQGQDTRTQGSNSSCQSNVPCPSDIEQKSNLNCFVRLEPLMDHHGDSQLREPKGQPFSKQEEKVTHDGFSSPAKLPVKIGKHSKDYSEVTTEESCPEAKKSKLCPSPERKGKGSSPSNRGKGKGKKSKSYHEELAVWEHKQDCFEITNESMIKNCSVLICPLSPKSPENQKHKPESVTTILSEKKSQCNVKEGNKHDEKNSASVSKEIISLENPTSDVLSETRLCEDLKISKCMVLLKDIHYSSCNDRDNSEDTNVIPSSNNSSCVHQNSSKKTGHKQQSASTINLPFQLERKYNIGKRVKGSPKKRTSIGEPSQVSKDMSQVSSKQVESDNNVRKKDELTEDLGNCSVVLDYVEKDSQGKWQPCCKISKDDIANAHKPPEQMFTTEKHQKEFSTTGRGHFEKQECLVVLEDVCAKSLNKNSLQQNEKIDKEEKLCAHSGEDIEKINKDRKLHFQSYAQCSYVDLGEEIPNKTETNKICRDLIHPVSPVEIITPVLVPQTSTTLMYGDAPLDVEPVENASKASDLKEMGTELFETSKEPPPEDCNQSSLVDGDHAFNKLVSNVTESDQGDTHGPHLLPTDTLSIWRREVSEDFQESDDIACRENEKDCITTVQTEDNDTQKDVFQDFLKDILKSLENEVSD